jgi:predicted PilT family ATPase
MSYFNGPIKKEEYQKAAAGYQEALNALEEIKELVKLHQDNRQFPFEFRFQNVEDIIHKTEEKVNKLRRQFECSHTNTTGLINIGHDSHKDHYENKCLDCELILEWDVY